MITIRNKKTGEVKQIEETQLQDFGFAPKIGTGTTPATTTTTTTPKITKDQLFNVFLDPKIKAGTKANVKTLYDVQIQEDEANEPTDTELTAQKKKKDVAIAAKNYLDTYKSLSDKGDLTSEDAQRQLAYAAGKYNSIAGFGEGGKTLTASELGILAPTLIKTQRQREQNVFEKTVGTQPQMTQGLLQEDPTTAAEKMKLALKNTDPELYSQYKDLTMGQLPKTSAQGEKLNPDFIGNVLNNASDIVKAFPSLAKTALEFSPATPVVDMLQGNYDPVKQAKIAMEIGKGLIQNLGETTGISYDDKGQFHFSPKDAFVHDYNHPIDTALWILPFLKGIGGKGIIGRAAKDADLAGKSAESIAIPFPESIIKTDEIMSKAILNTTSNSMRGMAKELETSIPKYSKVIEDWAIKTDKTIGSQPLDDIVNQVMTKVVDTTSAQANPELLKTLETKLRNKLNIGQLEGGAKAGNFDATNFKTINEARKYFTSSLESWFNSGMPVGTATNDLRAMNWAAANGLKEIIAEADIKGIVKDALDKQHVAFSTSPVISRLALKTGGKVGSIGYKWGLIRKAWEATGGKVMENVRIRNARRLQVQPNPLDTFAPKTGGSNYTTPRSTSGRLPLETGLVTDIFSKKSEPQMTRLLQDNLLSKFNKRRYK